MEIIITKPIEDFIKHQMAKGYSDPSEVIRQALLRWMEEEDYDPLPPNVNSKLEQALQGKFVPYDPSSLDRLLDETK